LPFVIYLAAFIGIVTPKQLRKYRRHAIIALFICSALITPPDVFTLIILAIPLIALYEFGILMAVFAQKKKNKSVSD
ncbi:twin-arginine translocase subunit TatC, partial [bacterium]|nr:twin-arginine translocase subunit TatC [bacterium]